MAILTQPVRLRILFYNGVRTHRLTFLPKDVHNLHLGLGQRIDFLLILNHVI